MKQSIDIVNIASATYQYNIGEDRQSVLCQASSTVVNTIVAEQNYEIILYCNKNEIFIGDIFEYTIKIKNIGSTKDIIMLMNQIPNDLQVINFTINPMFYDLSNPIRELPMNSMESHQDNRGILMNSMESHQNDRGLSMSSMEDNPTYRGMPIDSMNFNQIKSGLSLGPIGPDQEVTVVIQVQLIEQRTINIYNRAYVFVYCSNNSYERYDSNMVCTTIYEKYRIPIHYQLCTKRCPNRIRRILSIKQQMVGYRVKRCSNNLVIDGCIRVRITYCNCCNELRHHEIDIMIQWCIPMEMNATYNIENIQLSSLDITGWNLCNGRLIMNSKTMICGKKYFY